MDHLAIASGPRCGHIETLEETERPHLQRFEGLVDDDQGSEADRRCQIEDSPDQGYGDRRLHRLIVIWLGRSSKRILRPIGSDWTRSQPKRRHGDPKSIKFHVFRS